MNIVLTILGTLLVTFIIVSPFLWLRFLYQKDRKLYVFYSTLATVGIFMLFVLYIYKYVLQEIHSYHILDIFDSISMGSIYITLFLSIISPFIFTKIIYGKVKIKSFLISLLSSVVIFIIYVLTFVYILLPMAFDELNRRL